MRIFDLYLNGKQVGNIYCDEQCDSCIRKFACYTTAWRSVIRIDNPTSWELGQLDKKENYFMRCPHCQEFFQVTLMQVNNNTKFKCPSCHKYNEGSCEADENGILIGVA